MKVSMSWIKLGLLVAGALCSTLGASSVVGQEWADLKMTFTYDGKAPALNPSMRAKIHCVWKMATKLLPKIW